MRCVRVTIVAVEENSVFIIYFECVSVALLIQHAWRMRYFVTCGCPALQYFSTLSHKWHDFREKRNKLL